MMTIKQFAALCSCSTQTLRYYDRIDLLKPVKVDQWSGYRYYEVAQAIDFVKIKNLQAADFSISEIKQLLGKSDGEIYDAFTQKIAEQEQKLERIIEIQQSYLKEKSGMENLINNLSDFLLRQLSDFEALREFGLAPDDGPKIVEHIKNFFLHHLGKSVRGAKNVTLVVDDKIFRGEDEVARVIFELDEKNLPETILFGDEDVVEEEEFDISQFDALWKRDGWEHVYEFIDDIPSMEDGGEYCFYFELNEERYRKDISFSMCMLGAMILKKGDVKVQMNSSVERSEDGENHFALLKKK